MGTWEKLPEGTSISMSKADAESAFGSRAKSLVTGVVVGAVATFVLTGGGGSSAETNTTPPVPTPSASSSQG